MLDRVLFSLGSFDVTIKILIYLFVLIILIVAVIAFRRNYILQMKLSQLVDPESSVHNSQGTVVNLRRRRNKIRKVSVDNDPALLIVRIDNLGSLYIGYHNRSKLMRTIVEVFRYDLNKQEFVTRVDFNKFCVVLANRDTYDIKSYIYSLNDRLNTLDIENYGLYTFYLTCGVYEHVPLEYPKTDLELALATLSYATVRDGNIYFYNEDVLNMVKRIELINASKEAALDNNQFIPYIQPRIDFRTGRVVGGEILVRWLDGNETPIYEPREFIPLFETNGFIKKIDMLMFKAACELQQLVVASGHNDVIISSNFSRLTLNNAYAADELKSLVTQYNVNPATMELEVTESDYMENANAFATTIARLKQQGFKVSMDDFGKKESSISLLSNTSFDTICADRFLFESGLNGDKDKFIAKNVVNLLSNVGHNTVLEGIETKPVLDYLATVDRDVLLQGYYFSKPMPVTKFVPFLDRVFEFDYADEEEIEEEVVEEEKEEKEDTIQTTVQTLPNGNTSINISGIGGQNNEHDKEMEEMRRQMDEMRHQFELSLEEQKRLAHEEEMKRIKEEMEKLKNAPKEQQPSNKHELEALRLEIERLRLSANNTNTTHTQTRIVQRERDYRDDEIYHLKREIDNLRYDRERDRERHYYDRGYYVTDRYVNLTADNSRDRELDLLQKQIDDLKENQKNQPVFNIDELVEKLTKTQNDSRYQIEKAQAEVKSLSERLDQERKEREELEKLIDDLKNSEPEPVEEIDETSKEKEQEEADKNLNLDLSTLSKSNAPDDDDDEDEDEEEEKLEKPTLSLEELEAIIQSYRDKYEDEWNQHAKEELQDGYWEIIDGLKYYERKKQNFLDRLRSASPELKQLFNIVKNELMKYKDVKNRLTKKYDCFYLGRNQICKLSLTSKKVKVYLAADPAQYPERQFPHKDVSDKKSHVRTPYYTMVKSQLSVKRMNKVIADIMAESNTKVNPDYKPVDFVNKLKYMKTE